MSMSITMKKIKFRRKLTVSATERKQFGISQKQKGSNEQCENKFKLER